jgi:hypothetical protein
VARGIAFGVVFGVTVGVAIGQWNTADSTMQSNATGLVLGIIIGSVLSVAYGGIGGVTSGAVLGIAVGTTAGILVGAVLGVSVLASYGVAGGLAFGQTFGTAIGVLSGVVVGAIVGMLLGVFFGVVVGIAVGVGAARVLDWLIAWALIHSARSIMCGSRVTPLPLPGLRQRLASWLSQDWPCGVDNANQLLAYTLQFIPVVGAVNDVLGKLPPHLLAPAVVRLVEKPFDWDLLRFSSAKLSNRLWQATVDGFFLLPSPLKQRWRSCFSIELRLDTPARAICAGFWLWHTQEAVRAVEAFAVVADLPGGKELYGIAQAIALGQNVLDLPDLAEWEDLATWLDACLAAPLRPGTVAALRTLQAVAADARVAQHALAPLNRSTALNRAIAALTGLINTENTTCPEPEWPLIRGVAEKWHGIVSRAGGVIGDEVLRRPAPNPYEGYSGLPVTGHTFIGRRDILMQIETHWTGGDRLPPLILYGHRRMGKSSILRNLGHAMGTDTVLAYLDLQDAGWVDHTGQLLLDFAQAIHSQAAMAGLDAGAEPTEGDYTDLGTARRGLNALFARLDPQMAGRRLILAVDEFEILQQRIEDGRVDPGVLHYLRAKVSDYRWLGLVFAGLHMLDEMGRDYRSAFYGAAEHIRVGYLSHDEAVQLITRPHPDFSLEYAADLREKLYSLTHGQPYLLQRLCWELINRWNERFLRDGAATPRVIVLDELDSVLTRDFFAAAGYYFDGVWSNITEDERRLMRVIAGREEGAWTLDELITVTGESEVAIIEEALKLLRRHDAVLIEAGCVRFASELMRQWVVLQDRSHAGWQLR